MSKSHLIYFLLIYFICALYFYNYKYTCISICLYLFILLIFHTDLHRRKPGLRLFLKLNIFPVSLGILAKGTMSDMKWLFRKLTLRKTHSP